MARADKLLAAMRANPSGWSMADVERLCRHYDIQITAPKRGSHFKVWHPAVVGKLTLPFRKPIKRVYILLVLDLIDRLD